MKNIKTCLVLLLLFSASIAGCLSEDEEKSELNLQVDYDSLNGTIIESYSDGELISSDIVTIKFDFSKTTSAHDLSLFGVDTNDSRNPIEVNAKEASIIMIDFSEHGIYELTLYAIDEDGNQEDQSLKVKINLRIEWIELSTISPESLMFDPTPSNGGEHAEFIEIESTVENPNQIEEFGGGQSVGITWSITDEYDDTCQKNSDQVDNGDSVTWITIHFNTYLVHELNIEYDDGQDDINVNQSVSIIYGTE